MPREHTRTSRLEARIAPGVLAIIKRAAELQERSISDFVVAAAESAAREAIESTDIIKLAVEDQMAIAEAILNPPPLTPALQRAIARHHTIIRQKE